MTNDPASAAPGTGSVRHDMADEARRLIDAARAEGLTLRLLGGLGVREHCRTLELCARDYSDLDMVAPIKQGRRLAALFKGFGYAENYEVSAATANGELQFVRPCEHGGKADSVHTDDHIDVFLGTFRMDHEISLEQRLELEPELLGLDAPQRFEVRGPADLPPEELAALAQKFDDLIEGQAERLRADPGFQEYSGSRP